MANDITNDQLVAALGKLRLPELQGVLGQVSGEQFDLGRLLGGGQSAPSEAFQGFAGQPIATPISGAGGALPGAAGQTFAPSQNFTGGAVFAPKERPAIIQNSLVLARNLAETLSQLRRQRETRKKTQAKQGGKAGA